MRIIYTLLATILILTACNKPEVQTPTEPPATEDTTNPAQPVLKDSTIKITGIDSIVTMPYFDSISIPITISKDAGINQNVTLSISGLPVRVKAKFEQTTGTPPFTTNLKLYTYMVGGEFIRNQIITITVSATSGQSTTRQFKLKINNYGDDVLLDFYNIHKKDQNWGGPTINYNPNSKKLYLTDIYLGVFNNKAYYSIDDDIIITNNITSDGRYLYDIGLIEFLGIHTIKGRSGVDTFDFHVQSPSILFYYVNDTTDGKKIILSYKSEIVGNSNEYRAQVYGYLDFDY